MRKWIREHQDLIGCVLLALFGVGIAADLFLVLVLHAKSISMATWLATKAHPTIQVAIVLAGYGIAALIRKRWYLAATAVGLACHLGTHW
ncbi:MAG TPA: hypothetical protein VKS79_21150 [Gemmataceae bacterium]|nr:hypothetical protein [Gemmataceae bacterium]